jgi:hypothetical protein
VLLSCAKRPGSILTSTSSSLPTELSNGPSLQHVLCAPADPASRGGPDDVHLWTLVSPPSSPWTHVPVQVSCHPVVLQCLTAQVSSCCCGWGAKVLNGLPSLLCSPAVQHCFLARSLLGCVRAAFMTTLSSTSGQSAPTAGGYVCQSQGVKPAPYRAQGPAKLLTSSELPQCSSDTRF